MSGQTIASQDISFPAMKEKQQELAQMTLTDPAIDTVTAFAGGGRGSNNTGFMFIALKPSASAPIVPMPMIGSITCVRSFTSTLPTSLQITW